jgi:hypothetical protein
MTQPVTDNQGDSPKRNQMSVLSEVQKHQFNVCISRCVPVKCSLLLGSSSIDTLTTHRDDGTSNPRLWCCVQVALHVVHRASESTAVSALSGTLLTIRRNDQDLPRLLSLDRYYTFNIVSAQPKPNFTLDCHLIRPSRALSKPDTRFL